MSLTATPRQAASRFLLSVDLREGDDLRFNVLFDADSLEPVSVRSYWQQRSGLAKSDRLHLRSKTIWQFEQNPFKDPGVAWTEPSSLARTAIAAARTALPGAIPVLAPDSPTPDEAGDLPAPGGR